MSNDNRTLIELAAGVKRGEGYYDRGWAEESDVVERTCGKTAGIGGAPTRCTTLPEDAAARKEYPLASGVLDYFPDALIALAYLSSKGNQQHNPDKPLHWDRSKSTDEADTLMRHFVQRGTLDADGIRHSVKVAWRALALLQKEIEGEK